MNYMPHTHLCRIDSVVLFTRVKAFYVYRCHAVTVLSVSRDLSQSVQGHVSSIGNRLLAHNVTSFLPLHPSHLPITSAAAKVKSNWILSSPTAVPISAVVVCPPGVHI